MSGQTSYCAGASAEAQVAEHYRRRGCRIADLRWRGTAGEIDLVVSEGDTVVFIEVKKSRSFARAAERLSDRQVARIYGAASEYIGQLPQGQLTDTRFDLALVDAQGAIRIIEGAFGV